MLKGLAQSRNKREKKKRSTKPTLNNQKMAIGTYISIITLNVNGLNSPIKRHRLAEWIQNQDPYICCLQETHFRLKDTQTESERIEKYITFKQEAKEAGVAILISDKVDLKIKNIERNKDRWYTMIKRSKKKT